jgi:uncharacterized protein (DUF302 family)
MYANVATSMSRLAARFGHVSTLIVTAYLYGASAMAADGLITLPSRFGPKDTINRLEAEVNAKGMKVFARIDHAAEAAQAGLTLRPTEVIIFGSPKGGTPLMQSAQTIAIDLPLRVLVWQDASDRTWLSYYDVNWLAGRHGVQSDVQANVSRIALLLEAVAKGATGDR